MSEWDNMSNDELKSEQKRLQFEHQAAKQETVKAFDKMVSLEKRYARLIEEKNKRNIK